MKKPVKTLRKVIFTFIIALLILIVAIKLYANSAVKWGIETAGKQTLKVNVKVDSASIDILTGTIGLKKLVVDNPEGYQSPNLLDMDTGKMHINAATLLNDTVKIKEIKLDGVNVTLEQKDIRGNNIQDILKNIQQTMETQPSGKKLLIETLEISNINVNAKLSVAGSGGDIQLPLKTITMTNLGSDNKLDTAKLISQILLAISLAIAEEGGGVIPDDIINPLNMSLSQIDELTKTLLEEDLKFIDSAGQGREELKNITEGLKDLIEQKKDEEQ